MSVNGMHDGMKLKLAGIDLGPVSDLSIDETQRVVVHELLSGFAVEDGKATAGIYTITGAFFGGNGLYYLDQLKKKKDKGEPVKLIYVEDELASWAREVMIRRVSSHPGKGGLHYTIELVEYKEIPKQLARKIELPDLSLALALVALDAMKAKMKTLKAATLAYTLAASAGKATTAMGAALAVAQKALR